MIKLASIITCPECGNKSKETMPTDACQVYWKCPNCGKALRPKKGDCCVYCSYGDVACPPIQQDEGEDCCGTNSKL